ncbi:hypothetical protein AMTRI_Chr08g160120 [Amborella trichopoda]
MYTYLSSTVRVRDRGPLSFHHFSLSNGRTEHCAYGLDGASLSLNDFSLSNRRAECYAFGFPFYGVGLCPRITSGLRQSTLIYWSTCKSRIAPNAYSKLPRERKLARERELSYGSCRALRKCRERKFPCMVWEEDMEREEFVNEMLGLLMGDEKNGHCTETGDCCCRCHGRNSNNKNGVRFAESQVMFSWEIEEMQNCASDREKREKVERNGERKRELGAKASQKMEIRRDGFSETAQRERYQGNKEESSGLMRESSHKIKVHENAVSESDWRERTSGKDEIKNQSNSRISQITDICEVNVSKKKTDIREVGVSERDKRERFSAKVDERDYASSYVASETDKKGRIERKVDERDYGASYGFNRVSNEMSTTSSHGFEKDYNFELKETNKSTVNNHRATRIEESHNYSISCDLQRKPMINPTENVRFSELRDSSRSNNEAMRRERINTYSSEASASNSKNLTAGRTVSEREEAILQQDVMGSSYREMHNRAHKDDIRRERTNVTVKDQFENLEDHVICKEDLSKRSASSKVGIVRDSAENVVRDRADADQYDEFSRIGGTDIKRVSKESQRLSGVDIVRRENDELGSKLDWVQESDHRQQELMIDSQQKVQNKAEGYIIKHHESDSKFHQLKQITGREEKQFASKMTGVQESEQEKQEFVVDSQRIRDKAEGFVGGSHVSDTKPKYSIHIREKEDENLTSNSKWVEESGQTSQKLTVESGGMVQKRSEESQVEHHLSSTNSNKQRQEVSGSHDYHEKGKSTYEVEIERASSQTFSLSDQTVSDHLVEDNPRVVATITHSSGPSIEGFETKGPSDEMWDVSGPSALSTTGAGTGKPPLPAGNTIVKRSSKSLWSYIADIIRKGWGPTHTEPSHSTPKSGNKSSTTESGGSEAWFSGHEPDDDNSKKREKMSRQEDPLPLKKPVDQPLNQRQEGFGAVDLHERVAQEDIKVSTSTGYVERGSIRRRASFTSGKDYGSMRNEKGTLEEVVSSSSSVYESPLPQRFVEATTGGEKSSETSENMVSPSPQSFIEATIEGAKPVETNKPVVVFDKTGASSSITELHGGSARARLLEDAQIEEREGELRARKLKRNMQVQKERFELWEEAFKLETEQRKADEFFMREALSEAKKAGDNWEVPVGAVLVQNGKIIARGYNLVEESRDSTAHAEMICIREASNLLKSWRLADTTLYVTLEPCPMCAGAILQARIDVVVWGAPNRLLGADGSWVSLFPSGAGEEGKSGSDQLNQRAGPIHPFHPNITVRRGVLATECSEVMQEFFQLRRKAKKKPETPPPEPSWLPVSNHPSKFLTKIHDAFGMMFCL